MDGNLRKEGGRVYGQMPSHTSSHNGHSMKKKKVNKVNKSAVSHPPPPPRYIFNVCKEAVLVYGSVLASVLNLTE